MHLGMGTMLKDGRSLDPVFQYAPGDAGGTFTRASAANQLDAGGALQNAAINTLRDAHYITGIRHTLLELARTNLLAAPTVPATQTLVALAAGTYTLSVVGTGSCTVSGAAAGVATAGVPFTFVAPGAVDAVFTVAGALTRFQCELGLYASSFFAGARALDNYQRPITFLPQLLTFVLDFTELGSVTNGGSQRLLRLCNAAGAAPNFTILETGGKYRVIYNDGTASSTGTLAAFAAPVIGDHVVLGAILYPNGNAQIWQSINGAAPSFGTLAAGATLQPTWSGNILWIGNGGNGSLPASIAYRAVKVYPYARTFL